MNTHVSAPQNICVANKCKDPEYTDESTKSCQSSVGRVQILVPKD